MKPRIGFFKYDLFPYFVWSRFTKWSDEGNPTTDNNMSYKREAMIASFPEDEAQKYVDALEKAKGDYQKKERELRDRLSEELYSVAYFLKPKEVKDKAKPSNQDKP